MIGRADWRWFWIVLASWLVILGASRWPASWWFDVDRVHVSDARVGETPLMEVKRTIKRPNLCVRP